MLLLMGILFAFGLIGLTNMPITVTKCPYQYDDSLSRLNKAKAPFPGCFCFIYFIYLLQF